MTLDPLHQTFDRMATKRVGELAFAKAGKRPPRSMTSLRNAAYDAPITFGNFLLYVPVPAKEVNSASLNEQVQRRFDLECGALNRCNSSADVHTILDRVFKEEVPHYIVNNYGDPVSVASETLLDYKWTLPLVANLFMHGAMLAITVKGKSRVTFVEPAPR